VVIVAHNVEADIKYLQSLGLQPLALVNDCLDTADLYQALRSPDKPPLLASVLLDLGIATKYLHNGGNDARYTLQAMLAMAYEHINAQKSANEWKDELEARVQMAVEEAETRVRVEFQGLGIAGRRRAQFA
jgi:DNA polymerase III alpha subunit (gram-positive type)